VPRSLWTAIGLRAENREQSLSKSRQGHRNRCDVTKLRRRGAGARPTPWKALGRIDILVNNAGHRCMNATTWNTRRRNGSR